MKKLVLCVLLAVSLALCFTHAIAAVTVELGSISFLLPDNYECYESKEDSITYMNQLGNIVMAFVLDSRPNGPAIYENTGNLIHFISALRDNSMPTAEIIAFDECAALYEVTDHASLIIYNRYDVISLFVYSDSDASRDLLIDIIRLSANAKETPLRESEVKASQYDDMDFTLEVDQYDFKFFLPSTFEVASFSSESYTPTNSSFYPYVSIEPEVSSTFLHVDAFYTDREELRASIERIASYDPSCEIIEMDECLGIIYFWESTSSDSCFAVINVTNRKDICDVTVVSDSLDDALELAHAIIDHAVAKEIPLDELEQDL